MNDLVIFYWAPSFPKTITCSGAVRIFLGHLFGVDTLISGFSHVESAPTHTVLLCWVMLSALPKKLQDAGHSQSFLHCIHQLCLLL